jgi:hypothetical protein
MTAVLIDGAGAVVLLEGEEELFTVELDEE